MADDDFLRELYGTVIHVYTDRQAIEDGILIPFVTTKRDTGHRVTANAWNALREYYADRCRDYGDNDFYRFLFAELLPIAPYAVREWDDGRILKTDFDFKVGRYDAGEPNVLWHIPNHNTEASVTMMRPEDY